MATTNNLDTDSLALMHGALNLLSSVGFTFVDLPWAVYSMYSDATRPKDARDFETPLGSLVASGEQSFLQMWNRRELPPLLSSLGYVGWTPCFRDEPVHDELHQGAFLKVEWFVPFPKDPGNELQALLEIQKVVFISMAQMVGVDLDTAKAGIEVEQTDTHAYDINVGGIEIGSYGLRYFMGGIYLYGTGLALPRFNVAFAKLRNK